MLRYDDDMRKWIEDEQDRRVNAMSCAAACMYIAGGVVLVCMIGVGYLMWEAL